MQNKSGHLNPEFEAGETLIKLYLLILLCIWWRLFSRSQNFFFFKYMITIIMKVTHASHFECEWDEQLNYLSKMYLGSSGTILWWLKVNILESLNVTQKILSVRLTFISAELMNTGHLDMTLILAVKLGMWYFFFYRLYNSDQKKFIAEVYILDYSCTKIMQFDVKLICWVCTNLS